MNITILGSRKPQFKLSKEEAINFGGKSAGICYMPGDIETLFSEPSPRLFHRVQFSSRPLNHL